MSDQANQAQAVDQGPLSPGAVKALKIAIVVMGIMIIIGVALVIGRVIYLVSRSDTPQASIQEAAQYELVPSINLPIPAGATVEHVTLDGPRIAVTFNAGGQSSIVIFNLSTGKKITDIQLKPGGLSANAVPQGE